MYFLHTSALTVRATNTSGTKEALVRNRLVMEREKEELFSTARLIFFPFVAFKIFLSLIRYKCEYLAIWKINCNG